MAKPKIIANYGDAVTAACERVLVTLLRHLGPWKDTVFLVGGLAPRYLIKARPPAVRPHAGTGDVDVVIDLAMLADVEAYRTLEDNLHRMGFQRSVNARGTKVNWRWEADVDGGKIILEFLADDPEMAGGKVRELPTDGNVSAVNIPHASIVRRFHNKIDVTADLLDDAGQATETVRFADIVSFTCLKALAYDDRREPKDAHDLVYCLENFDGGPEAALEQFRAALETEHRHVIQRALAILQDRFRAADPDDSYRRDGPVAVARFEDNEADVAGDETVRDLRLLRQRQAAEIVGTLTTQLCE